LLKNADLNLNQDKEENKDENQNKEEVNNKSMVVSVISNESELLDQIGLLDKDLFESIKKEKSDGNNDGRKDAFKKRISVRINKILLFIIFINFLANTYVIIKPFRK